MPELDRSGMGRSSSSRSSSLSSASAYFGSNNARIKPTSRGSGQQGQVTEQQQRESSFELKSYGTGGDSFGQPLDQPELTKGRTRMNGYDYDL